MRARILVTLLLVVGLVLPPRPATAQGFTQIGMATFTADVAVVTTTEKDVIYSGAVTAPRQTVNVCIIAWAQLTTGTMTTTVTPRIRRGTGITGTVVGEANAETILNTAGSTEKYYLMACEDRSDVASVDYSFTLQQASANGNGAALQGGILVFVR